MKLERPRGGALLDDRMLPLVNLVFLLMVLFLLLGAIAAPMALDPQVPRSDAEQRSDRGGEVLQVDAEGRLALGGRLIEDAELDSALRSWKRENPGQALRLLADAGIRAERVLALLERVHVAGLGSVQVLAEGRRR